MNNLPHTSQQIPNTRNEDVGEDAESSSQEDQPLAEDKKKFKGTRVHVTKAKASLKGDAAPKNKKVKPVVSSEVIQWLSSLCLPAPVLEKYIALFAEEEIFYMTQVLCLKEHHLHDWMGVKTGSVLLMLDSIKKAKEQPDYLAALSQIPIPSYIATKEKEEAEKNEKKEKEKEKENKEKDKETKEKDREQKNLEKMNEKIEQKEKKGEVYQAGGHGGVVITSPGLVRKKTVAAEITFYKEFQTLSFDAIPEHIRTFFPTLVSASKKSVIMEDLTYGNVKPCIMDVKMGTRTAGENANKIKKNFMISKDKATTTASYGLRIVAARTYNNQKGVWQALSRGDCNSIADHTSLENALGSFFLTGNEQPRIDVLDVYIARMEVLKEWMEKQTSFRFYSSSLLFVYDGDDKSPLRADVRMIDFAHVHEINDGGIDEGYLKGLTNLLSFFKRYKKDAVEKKSNQILTDKSIFHVENPEESEYFEMRPKAKHSGSVSSDEDALFYQHYNQALRGKGDRNKEEKGTPERGKEIERDRKVEKGDEKGKEREERDRNKDRDSGRDARDSDKGCKDDLKETSESNRTGGTNTPTKDSTKEREKKRDKNIEKIPLESMRDSSDSRKETSRRARESEARESRNSEAKEIEKDEEHAHETPRDSSSSTHLASLHIEVSKIRRERGNTDEDGLQLPSPHLKYGSKSKIKLATELKNEEEKNDFKEDIKDSSQTKIENRKDKKQKSTKDNSHKNST